MNVRSARDIFGVSEKSNSQVPAELSRPSESVGDMLAVRLGVMMRANEIVAIAPLGHDAETARVAQQINPPQGNLDVLAN